MELFFFPMRFIFFVFTLFIHNYFTSLNTRESLVFFIEIYLLNFPIHNLIISLLYT